MIEKLDEGARVAALQTIALWDYDATRDAVSRKFKFKNFVEAFAFMTKVAELAEQANHHPEWSNIYNQVVILLTTHDAGGLSDKDIALAKEIDAI